MTSTALNMSHSLMGFDFQDVKEKTLATQVARVVRIIGRKAFL
jgi:hypothetical protein